MKTTITISPPDPPAGGGSWTTKQLFDADVTPPGVYQCVGSPVFAIVIGQSINGRTAIYVSPGTQYTAKLLCSVEWIFSSKQIHITFGP